MSKTSKQLGEESAQVIPFRMDTFGDYPREVYGQNGLTKREIFAMAAMQGAVANAGIQGLSYNGNPGIAIAVASVSVAEALLKELAKGE